MLSPISLGKYSLVIEKYVETSFKRRTLASGVIIK